MNKRIKKKHNPRFNFRLIVFSFFELEQALGSDIDHKIKRSLINRRLREYRKEPKNTEMIDFNGVLLEEMRMASIEQSFHPMNYYENKSMEE
jgi:hypothetical protein